jgi:hypothetical protein
VAPNGHGCRGCALDRSYHPAQTDIDGGEGRLAVRDGQERQVEVHRQPWHGAMEQVDRGAALQREVRLFGHVREDADEERDARLVPFNRLHRGSVDT